MKTTIIGNGAMATVCALILSPRYPVRMWGPNAEALAMLARERVNERYLPGARLPDEVELTADPEEALAGCELIINAIPTQYIRATWERFVPLVGAGVPVVSVSKGIEQQTLLRPTQIVRDVLGDPARVVASLSGPTVAEELVHCLPATLCAASEEEPFAEALQAMFSTHWLRTYTNTDLLGVELAGATKNVIALAAGAIDGLRAGINAKSALLARGLAEISRLGLAMGARQETFFGIAGVGDLATTCFSPSGRNRTCGEMLGRGRKLDEVLEAIPGVVEGVPTTRAVVALARQHGVEMPLTQAIHRVLFEGLDPIEGISSLMSRDLKAERVN
ncbi:NAD(P)H-dependent glycerol-3-phosphate dehydrogenase [Mucisphaera calidilacus]|uniref:Glycerol-3-phosphate dehydrogenase [NAD(P)+] n=1 Tax=Mucisphaera calidilacus TaxID=2527982 RepID=A0A518BTF8_9BACT|nr:NAD(P)H-dependent glycerol-3-phosphate dehydrogenase [Mucisphaera calidilacus]QDU70258.1 Glycerol-3-phosphate dehydrogenase [NAD(P)+] [Mucisphaera calidilacus]